MKLDKDLSYGIDIARVVACFLVILLHVAAVGFHSFSDNWWKSNLVDSFSRVCVPIFIMITGSLLITDRNITFSSISLRLRKVILICLFWSVFYSLTFKLYPFNLKWLVRLFTNDVMFHLWYLYAMIGFYISIPILSAIYMSLSRKTIIAIIAFWVIATNIPMLSEILKIKFDILKSYQLSFLSNLIGYLLVGKLISDLYIENKQSKWFFHSVWLYIASGILIMLFTYLISQEMGRPDTTFYSNYSFFVMLASASIYSFILGINKFILTIDKKLIVKKISKYTLGIYCIHIFTLEFITQKIITYYGKTLTFTHIILAALVTFIISFTIIFLMKKIKYIRSFL